MVLQVWPNHETACVASFLQLFGNIIVGVDSELRIYWKPEAH